MTTFDTLSAARGLEDAGMDAKQAAAVTATIRAAVAEDGLVIGPTWTRPWQQSLRRG